MRAYKIFTHDLRSPIQLGKPVWDGSTPYTLPTVAVDTSERECAAGWNACESPGTAARIASFWPNGWPARLFELETDAEVIRRGDKLRAATWRVVRELPFEFAIGEFSAKYFGDLAEEMTLEQIAWHEVLGRPRRDKARVKSGLNVALRKRGLDWQLKHYDTAWDALDAWGARDARDARDALAVRYASKREWVDYPADLLTVGLRSAYRYGLALALPTGPNELGWAMINDVNGRTDNE